jgi:hypothetical protein
VVSASGTGFGSTAWSSPGDAATSNNSYATFNESFFGATSQYLVATGFGFDLPENAIIDPLSASVEGKSTESRSRISSDYAVRLVKSGSVVGDSL